jgi:hypothetical protein
VVVYKPWDSAELEVCAAFFDQAYLIGAIIGRPYSFFGPATHLKIDNDGGSKQMDTGNLNVGETYKRKTAPKRLRKRRTLILVLAGSSAFIAIVIGFHQVGSTQTHRLQSANPAAEEITVSIVHPEPVGGVSLEEPGYKWPTRKHQFMLKPAAI